MTLPMLLVYRMCQWVCAQELSHKSFKASSSLINHSPNPFLGNGQVYYPCRRRKVHRLRSSGHQYLCGNGGGDATSERSRCNDSLVGEKSGYVRPTLCRTVVAQVVIRIYRHSLRRAEFDITIDCRIHFGTASSKETAQSSQECLTCPPSELRTPCNQRVQTFGAVKLSTFEPRWNCAAGSSHTMVRSAGYG